MPPNSCLLYLHALTPVHSGTGQAAGIIDLPISREKATGWPQIPGSSVKGVFRDLLGRTRADAGWIDAAFGSVDRAGELCFGDQRLLLLAVRSYFGTFAYVTCPLALTRLRRDLQALGLGTPLPEPPRVSRVDRVALAEPSALAHNARVYLEDLDLTVEGENSAGALAAALGAVLFETGPERSAFTERLAVVSDDLFAFLCETATEVAARVRLEEDTKTVASGGLWYEESVPAESVFCGPVLLERSRREESATPLRDTLRGTAGQLLQIGGDASVGRGLCRVIVGE